jgi:putative methionine-R-sulfoxide reductase with GAF domain
MIIPETTAELLTNVTHWVSDPGLSRDEVLARTVQQLHESCPPYQWVGIYLLEGDTLVLGPYVGKPTTHTRIPVGVGVCGTAVAQNANQRVDDVTALDNYLACSLETRSEIVILIRDREDPSRILGQIDIDSDTPYAFTPQDEAFLATVAMLLAERF